VRIMPLGDSITGGPGCWRALLWIGLRERGYTRVDFVGTRGRQDCPHFPPIYGDHDGDNEGHSAFLVAEVALSGQLRGWLAATHPDIVLMHFGTNDIWRGLSTSTVLDGYTVLLDQMRAANPATALLVAQIMPMAPSNCPDCGRRVAELNARIPSWAAAHTTARSPVIVVDQWTGVDPEADTRDGVHPNDSGNQKVADRWAAALAPLLEATAR